LAEPLQQRPGQPGGIAARAQAGIGAPYLRDLNPEQREAVVTLDGAVLVLAGAGTGKTRVLTTRIAHILATGRARPGEILAVTFTNKAAREMKVRVGAMVGGVVEGMPWLGTFHSIGVKILRRHAEMVGLKPDFTILDVDDQIRLLKQLLQAEGIDEKRWPARVLAQLIDGWKNRGLAPDQVPNGEAASFAVNKGKKLYAAYQERLKTLNAVDFGDLLIECIRLFREQPDVLRGFQQRCRRITRRSFLHEANLHRLRLELLVHRSSRPESRLFVLVRLEPIQCLNELRIFVRYTRPHRDEVRRTIMDVGAIARPRPPGIRCTERERYQPGKTRWHRTSRAPGDFGRLERSTADVDAGQPVSDRPWLQCPQPDRH